MVIVEKYCFQYNPTEYKVEESTEFLCVGRVIQWLLFALVNVFALVLARNNEPC